MCTTIYRITIYFCIPNYHRKPIKGTASRGKYGVLTCEVLLLTETTVRDCDSLLVNKSQSQTPHCVAQGRVNKKCSKSPQWQSLRRFGLCTNLQSAESDSALYSALHSAETIFFSCYRISPRNCMKPVFKKKKKILYLKAKQ